MIKGLFTAAPSCDVLQNIAQSLVTVTDGDMDVLRECLILLPTRRAIRVLEERLLDAFQIPTVLLPRIMAIGDIELPPEDEDSSRLPPRSISGLERIVSLLPYLKKHGLGGVHFNGQWRMAQEVARLIDLLQTEDLEIDAIGKMIAAADLAMHWQDNGGLFERVAQDWLQNLKNHNRINAAAGRTLRIQSLIDQWLANPLQTPVWLIGSTGSIPSVRRLMKQVLSLPQGAVLLPGVDTIMNDAEWAAMNDAHPQAILKRSIAELSYDRREVKIWPDCVTSDVINERHKYLSAALLPFPKIYKQEKLGGITIMAASTQQEEAEAITDYCVQHFINSSEKSLSIITNDPNLTSYLLPLLSTYQIELDSSAGLALEHTAFGQSLGAFIRILSTNASIIDLWQLLKSSDFAPYWKADNKDKILSDIERHYLRDPLKKPDSIEDLLLLFSDNSLLNLQDLRAKIVEPKRLNEWAGILHAALPLHFSVRFTQDKLAFDGAMTLLEDMMMLSVPHEISYEDAVGPLTEQIMRVSMRKPYRAHKTIQILGTMEARLMHSDVVILAGLNEGKWPDMPQPIPFISRGMRHSIGLPDTERHAALSGHDFQQAFLMSEIIITYAHRDSDAPLLPARWLLRLKAATDDAQWLSCMDRGNALLHSRRMRHAATMFEPASPPMPIVSKDVVVFPLFVTHMKTWRSDPYSFWAKHITRLRKPNSFLGDVDAAARGTIWHKIFKIFAEQYEDYEDKKVLFQHCVSTTLDEYSVPAHKQRAWRNRLNNLSAALLSYEEDRRSFSKPVALEQEWEGKIGVYSFKAKADRVDLTHGNALLLLDYKTGAPPKKYEIENGTACQLSLLAFIVGKNVYEIEYLSLTGGRNPIDSMSKLWDDEFSDATFYGVQQWIDMFLEQQHPFVSLANFGKLKNKDYLQLSRHAEWGIEA